MGVTLILLTLGPGLGLTAVLHGPLEIHHPPASVPLPLFGWSSLSGYLPPSAAT